MKLLCILLIAMILAGAARAADAPAVDAPAAPAEDLPVYALPNSAAADGDLSEWRGVPPAAEPKDFHWVDATVNPNHTGPAPVGDLFGPYVYVGRRDGSRDVMFLVVVKDRLGFSWESDGWAYGDCMELFVDFGREARMLADPNWQKDAAKWQRVPEMAQFGFLPRTHLNGQRVFGGPDAPAAAGARSWKIDYASVPVEGGVAYEVRVDGDSVVAALKLDDLPKRIGLDIGLMANDYPLSLHAETWVNERGNFRLFGDYGGISSPNRYGGLSTQPVRPAGDALPARTLASLYGANATPDDLAAAIGKRSPEHLADMLYWLAWNNWPIDAELTKKLAAVDSPRLQEVIVAVMYDRRNDRAARAAAVECAYLRLDRATPQCLVLANLINGELKVGHSDAAVRLLRHDDLTVAVTAARALAEVGDEPALKGFQDAMREFLAAAGAAGAAGVRATAARILMQPALDQLSFRLHPPPLPKTVAAREIRTANGDLPRFLPNDNSTVYDGAGLLHVWPAGGPGELWRAEIGLGWAAAVEAGGKTFAMGLLDKKTCAFCFEAATGKTLWKRVLEDTTRFDRNLAASPLADGGRAYFVADASGGGGTTFCLSAADGSVIWQSRDCPAQGYATPLIVGGVLYLPASGSVLAALDKTTGTVIWKSEKGSSSYASPAYQEIDGVGQLVASAGSELWGVSAASGEVFWKFPVNPRWGLCASPVVAGSRVLLTAGVAGEEFMACLQMFVANGRISELPVYNNRDTQASYAHTPAVWDGAVYGFGRGGMVCTDLATGQLLWRQTGRGWRHDRQLIVADGLIFAQTSANELVLLEADKTRYRERSRFKVPIQLDMQQPTLANGRLYLRGQTHVICYDVLMK